MRQLWKLEGGNKMTDNKLTDLDGNEITIADVEVIPADKPLKDFSKYTESGTAIDPLYVPLIDGIKFAAKHRLTQNESAVILTMMSSDKLARACEIGEHMGVSSSQICQLMPRLVMKGLVIVNTIKTRNTTYKLNKVVFQE